VKPQFRPTNKVTYGAAVSGIVGLTVWALNAYVLSVPIPAEIAVGIATTVTFCVQYMVADAPRSKD
jgi:hypothetical protein